MWVSREMDEKKNIKICFAASSGGHYEQLMMLKPLMEKYDSFVITEKTDYSAEAKGEKTYRQEDGYLEGGDCVVSWCLGHLAEYAAPEHYDERYENWRFEDLPILPAEWKLLVHSTKKPQFNVLRKLLRNKKFDYVVNACDAGREGEAIFRRVYLKMYWQAMLNEP